jgi:chromosome segregation protein
MSARLEEASTHLTEAAAALAALNDEVTKNRAAIEEKQHAHRNAQLRNNEVNRALDEQKSGYLDAMRKLSQVESRINSIEIERKSSASQEAKLAERAAILSSEAEQVEATKAQISEAIAAIVQQIDERKAAADERAGEQTTCRAAIKDLSARLGAAREQRSGLLSRQKMLRDLEARREGISDAVQRVLKQRESKFPFIRGLVADLLRVDVEHAHVIEAALDGRDQWLVADPSADLLDHREAFADVAGRVNVLRATPQQVIEFLPEDEREALRQEQPSLRVIAQSELLEVETDRAVSLADDTSIRFIPAGNVARPPIEDKHLIAVNGRFIDALASSTRPDGSPLAVTVGTSEDWFSDEDDEGYDWNQHSSFVRFAIDLVRFEPADRVIAYRLLGRTAVVDALSDALMLLRDGPTGWRYVTRSGEVVEADGTYRVGPLGASMGILSRRSELEAVTHQIAEADARIASLGDELAAGNEQAKTLEAAIGALRQEVYSLNTTRVEQAGKLQQAESRLAAIGRERPMIDRDLAHIHAAVAKFDAESATLTEQRETLTQRQAEHQEQIDALSGEQQGLVDALHRASEELTAARVAVGQLEEKQYGARQAVQRLESQRGEFAQQLERLTKSIETIVGRRGQIERDLAAAEHRREALAGTIGELETRVGELESQLSGVQASVETLAQDVEQVRAEKTAVEAKLHKLDLDLSEATVRMEGLVQRTQEEIQIDLAQRYAEVEEARKPKPGSGYEGEAAEGEQPQSGDQLVIDWEAIATEIRQLKERIQRLGNVNLDAIDELADLEKRQGDYEAQVADLSGAKSQLEELIEQINAESSVRFEQTFQAVREHFQLMFRKLFGGGKADIILETELEDKRAATADGDTTNMLPVMRRVDPLDAGIEVIARPPGKNPVTLSQLSGGEKAMTCIALLMSIFKAKPSPFCILDEVDAPLDEANNLRFTQIVQEFLSISQFIIITHHKKTMQIADQLYGVTQQVHGVSTRVPVRFDQVDTGGRIKDEAIVAA